MGNRNLAREQLDTTLQRGRALAETSAPPRGWIRAVRDSLGMSARQLATRLKVSQQWVAMLEKEERSGSVTVKTLRKVAEGLDCVLVCAFVPRTSLEGFVRTRAREVALKRLARASHTMCLEAQALSPGEDERVLAAMVDELAARSPSKLWDEQ